MLAHQEWAAFEKTQKKSTEREKVREFRKNCGDLEDVNTFFKVFTRFNTAQREAESTFHCLSDAFATYENLRLSITVMDADETGIADEERAVILDSIDETMKRYFDPMMALACVLDPRRGFQTTEDEPMFTEIAMAKTKFTYAHDAVEVLSCRHSQEDLTRLHNVLNAVVEIGSDWFTNDVLATCNNVHPFVFYKHLKRYPRNLAGFGDEQFETEIAEMVFFIEHVALKVFKLEPSALCVERINSSTGQIHDKKRVHLTAVRAEVMTYIFNNWRWRLARRRPLGAKPGKAAGAHLAYALGAAWDQ
eukprot:2719401-Rhodomonas_salina.2